MPDYLWVLALLLIGGLWYLNRRQVHLLGKNKRQEFTKDYFKGLNYLLNEQTDKAIEVFMRMLEVEKETIEIHMALGSLFRRSGEVERSIRIHQNLVVRPGMSDEQREKAQLELVRDYLRAGLLDRAETLLKDLIENDTFTAVALKYLADVYQQEREWARAIEILEKLEQVSGQSQQDTVAQYYCELAEQERRKNNVVEAVQKLHKALKSDKNCARASLMLGDLEIGRGNYGTAITHLKQVEKQKPEFLGEIIAPLRTAYTALGKSEEMLNYLQGILPLQNSAQIILTIAELLRNKSGDVVALNFVNEQLMKQPSITGLHWLIRVNLENREGPSKENLLMLRQLTNKIIEEKPQYQCNRCGFSVRSIYWQCPGCKNWNSLSPIHQLSVAE